VVIRAAVSSDGVIVPLGRRPEPAAAAEAATVGVEVSSERAAARVYVETYGCQMNVADSDMLVGILGGAGFTRVDDAATADVVLINTCAVREKAEERVFARAQELGALKRKNKKLVLAVVGCMAEHLKGALAERAPHVDVIAGPDSYRRITALLEAAQQPAVDGARARPRAPLMDVALDKQETYEGLSGAEGGDGVSGFVTIQRGCDKFCTFCVVPYTRGRERGTPPREVLRQVRALAAAGYREVVLLGQTVNSYVWEDVGFAELLRAVARVDGIERIRFTSPYPVDFTDEVIEAIATEPKICKYVHLPLQSGSDAVLERMRRGYGVADFRAIVARLRARIPAIAISTDILSGFGGETLDDHAQTLALMRELRFDSAFMFLYSEREQTYAARKIADDVPDAEKKRRLGEIIALQEVISAEVNAAQVGKRERVLVHSRSKRGDAMLGRTDGFKAVIVPAEAGAPGSIVDVEIARATMATLFGHVVSQT
jgi:tRNA-2-methylthio-N6-dimethylallyladenosine synthase